MSISIFHALGAYRELFRTGEIQATAEGENVLLDIRGNVAGDILVFIGPKNKAASDDADILELIQSDNKLEQQRKLAFNLLRHKFKGLTSLPESIVWIINIIISALYVYHSSGRILAPVSGTIDLNRILSLLPIIILAGITPFLAKVFGFKLLKPLISIIFWLVSHFRKALSRKAL